MIGIKKITKLLIAGIMFLLVISVFVNLYNNRSVFDISSWADKCILCNFENRHHCNLCKDGQRNCPFCGIELTKQKERK